MPDLFLRVEDSSVPSVLVCGLRMKLDHPTTQCYNQLKGLKRPKNVFIVLN